MDLKCDENVITKKSYKTNCPKYTLRSRLLRECCSFAIDAEIRQGQEQSIARVCSADKILAQFWSFLSHHNYAFIAWHHSVTVSKRFLFIKRVPSTYFIHHLFPPGKDYHDCSLICRVKPRADNIAGVQISLGNSQCHRGTQLLLETFVSAETGQIFILL